MPDSQTPQPQLLAEQMHRLTDNITSRLKSLEDLIKHQDCIQNERMETLRCDIRSLRSILDDHEKRIRSSQDAVTALKTWTGLSGGGSFFISVAALVRSLFGG
jgi:hypothetical protein